MFSTFAIAIGVFAFLQEEEIRHFAHLRLPVHGIVHDGRISGFFGPVRSSYPIISIAVDKPVEELWRSYTGAIVFPGAHFRHHVKFGAFWFGEDYTWINRIPLNQLHFFESASKNSFTQNLRKTYPAAEWLGASYGWIFDSLRQRYNSLRLQEGIQGFDMRRPEELAGLGWVPVSENSVKGFFLAKKKKMEIWEIKAKFNLKKQEWEMVQDNVNSETIKPLFEEDFYPFVRQNDYYFVTQSGQLFHAPPPKGSENVRIMKPLWDNTSFPIVAIIEDADRDQVWLFARSKNPNLKLDVFFEMKETTRAQSFDPAKLRPVAIEGRAKALLEYLPLISGKDKK